MKSIPNLSRITAVIVLYNTTDLVFKCLDKIKDVNIIIVDNGKNDLKIINSIKKNIKYLSILNSIKI